MMDAYELRRGSFKTLRLTVLPGGTVRVSAPWFVTKAFVDRFVADRAEWIADRRRTLGAEAPLAPGTTLAVWGVPLVLRVESPGRLPRVVVDLEARELVLRVPASWTPKQWQAALDKAEAERTAAALETLVPPWSQKMGLVPSSWSVRRMRSRWGSCQPSTRRLVFNARLSAYHARGLEYVVVHELAHLAFADHGPGFHALVNRWLPDAKGARDLLKLPPSGPTGPGAARGLPSIDGEETEP